MNAFHLPDLGEGLPDAEILEWHVHAGDTVAVDQLLVTVETAKAVVEVPSPQAGVITRLCAEPGDLVKTGQVLVEFGEAERADSGTVVGELRTSAHQGMGEAFTIGPSASTRDWMSQHLADFRGEVTTAATQGPATTLAPSATRSAPALPGASNATPLRGVRRAMALNMQRSHVSVVPVTLFDEVDVHAWQRGTDPLLRLIRAIVAGCQASPLLNAWSQDEPLALEPRTGIDLGLAVDTPDGLFVPVLRDIAQRTPADLRRGIDALRADVAARSIPPSELTGATITLSNFGSLAGRHATPIVVPPQVAIVGAGRLRDAIVAWEGQPAVHRLLPLSLTFDHRFATGGEAARFLDAMMRDLRGPD